MHMLCITKTNKMDIIRILNQELSQADNPAPFSK